MLNFRGKSILTIISVFCVVGITFSETDIRDSFGAKPGDANWDADFDYNADGTVDGEDLAWSILEQEKDQAIGQIPYNKEYVLVRFHPELKPVSQDGLLQRFNTGLVKSITPNTTGYHRVNVPLGQTVENFVTILKAQAEVAAAQPDFKCRKLEVPNDPLYRYQWNFDRIRAPEAYDLTFGGQSDVVIAVVDTGVAYEDYGEYSRGPDFAGTKFTSGYDFINDDTHPNDDDGHGTHVAGTIAQTTHNNLGVAGLAYACSIMPIKVLGADGTGGAHALSEGLRWAVDNGARVINMSLGFENGVNPGAIVQDAIEYAYSREVIVVAAAGNDGSSPSYHGGIQYPAAYPECVAVGAVRFDNQRSYYSNYGAEITCVAPGGDLGVDQNNDSYGDGILQQTFLSSNYSNFEYVFFQGTSMASPHVASAAALFLSRAGGGPSQFFNAIEITSTDLGSHGFDNSYGYGLIDLVNIIKQGQGWGADS